MSSCTRVEASTSSEDRRLLSTTNLPDTRPLAGTENCSVKNLTVSLVSVSAATARTPARSETDLGSSADQIDHEPSLPFQT